MKTKKTTFLLEQFPFDPGIDYGDVDVQNTLKTANTHGARKPPGPKEEEEREKD